MNTAPKTSLRLITSALALAAGLAIGAVAGAAVAGPATELGYQRTDVVRAPDRQDTPPSFHLFTNLGAAYRSLRVIDGLLNVLIGGGNSVALQPVSIRGDSSECVGTED